MGTAIRCTGLVKAFGATTALDGLDLEVATGEIHGFLGPNGSGKTVTMRVLLGLLRQDRGDVSVLGSDPWRDAVELHRRLAYVPGDTNLWPNLTGSEILDVLAEADAVVLDAVLAQQADVMDAIQRLRTQARAASSCVSACDAQYETRFVPASSRRSFSCSTISARAASSTFASRSASGLRFS